ncbi:hypothetical protein N7470_008698 [Penicillium chermesinum]|nr:hypothetical protein N7470_008698 [Penicillium chermesinum]
MAMIGGAEMRARRGELVRQRSDSWKRSTKDMWRKSTTMWSDLENKFHQTTVEVRHKSADSLSTSKEKAQQTTTKAWHRSAHSLSSSKNKAQESTMKAWDQSTDSWNHALNRYRQSTTGILGRSAENLVRPNKEVQQRTPLSDWMATSEVQQPDRGLDGQQGEQQGEQQGQPSSEPISPTAQRPPHYEPSWQSQRSRSVSSPPVQASQPAVQPQSSESPTTTPLPRSPSLPHSVSGTETNSLASSSSTIDLSSKKTKAADTQARALLDLTNELTGQLEEARQLRDLSYDQLGEIERQWVNTTITDADTANQELSHILEPLRIDMSKHRKGRLSSSSRKRWRAKDCERAQDKYSRVALQQGRLHKVIAHLSHFDQSQLSPQGTAEQPEELPISPVIELATETERFESLPAITELPDDPIFIPLELNTGFAELPSDPSPVRARPPRPLIPRKLQVPKIIVTQSPEDLLDTEVSTTDAGSVNQSTNEMHDNQAWKQTRDSYRDQQSASFTEIISNMDTDRSPCK